MDRKEFIKSGLTAGIGFCALQSLSSCGLLNEPEMLVCSLKDLQNATFFISKFNRKKIFVTYLDEELVIFSLICRHKRCTVAWEADEEVFLCPCHEGTYDKYGEVIDGPPPGPLMRFKHEIRGEEVWVLNEFVG